jgi:DNA-binding transcriptional ArsR family regulator
MHPLDALGNPVRREILLCLREGPLTVAALAERFPVSRPAISRHLQILVKGGLAEPCVEGYAINLQGFASVRAFLDDFWDNALARLQLLSRKFSVAPPGKKPRKRT